MLISVIIATYNRAELLRDSIESLLRLETGDEFHYEIVMIGNISTDRTRAVVEELSSSTSVSLKYFLETSPGVACSRNNGVRESSGDWIAFCDDDQIAEPDWLKDLRIIATDTKTMIQKTCGHEKLLLVLRIALHIGGNAHRPLFQSPKVRKIPMNLKRALVCGVGGCFRNDMISELPCRHDHPYPRE